MKVAAVILNYNDADETIEAVRRVAGYEILDTIIVVDNVSTDGSAEKLKTWLRGQNKRLLEKETDGEPEETEQFHRYMLVRAEENGGYGSGNNLGVRYAYEIAGAELVLIANPDVSFSEACVSEMVSCFLEDAGVGVVSAVEEAADGSPDYRLSAWPLRSFAGELLNSGPLCRRIFRNTLNYPEAYFRQKGAIAVDAVHGAFLMVDADRFMACGGFDEGMFLYGEENVLAFKMREHGCKTLLLPQFTYRHKGAGTISRENHAVKRQKMRQKSELYYYENYLEIGGLKKALAIVFQKLVLLETRLAKTFGRLS